MPWTEFRAWHKLAHERRIERMNNAQREERGLPPVSRSKAPDHGPQEAPPSAQALADA
jgi:hypothetical protein